nr:hypothetical protein [Tanacetum cinerariifolium]
MLIKLKWIYKIKTDEFGRVLKNKARLVGHEIRQEEGIKLEESFAPVTRIEAICAADPTLFTQKAGNDLLLVQIHVDDIIFASTNTAMCNEFANQMTTKFKMSMMGKMSFFLGLQISQSPRGIFINQSKYASEIVKKYGMLSNDFVDTPMVEKSKLDEDLQGKSVDATLYHGMIGCQDTRRGLSGSAQFLGDKLVSWSSKKQKSNAISSTKAEYIALSGCCSQILWKALLDALVSPVDSFEIGKCNVRLKIDIKPKEATFQVVLDALALTPFYQAFLITIEVPAFICKNFGIQFLFIMIELVDSTVRKIIKEGVNAQLPQILPQAISDVATPVIEKNVTESLEATVLKRSSSQPQSSYEAAATLSEFELTMILIDNMERNKSYDIADHKRELYDALVKSYQIDKDLFDSYGEVFH